MNHRDPNWSPFEMFNDRKLTATEREIARAAFDWGSACFTSMIEAILESAELCQDCKTLIDSATDRIDPNDQTNLLKAQQLFNATNDGVDIQSLREDEEGEDESVG